MTEGAARHTRDATVVFDIGGTWFRSAIFRSAIFTATGELVDATRRPAASFHRNPHTEVGLLQQELVDYLVSEATRLRGCHDGVRGAVVSMGAALNGRTGFVYDSGPLWGPRCRPFDLLDALRRRDPSINWRIVNDVTAALLRHVPEFGARTHGRMALITISSGIACRVYDFARGCVPLDPEHGLQGEIGHLAVPFAFQGKSIELPCDCGGRNHLNAFTSGRGIEAVLQHLAAAPDSGFATSTLGTDPRIADFVAAIQNGNAWCRSVLTACVQPLAGILAVMLTHDPELDPIVFVGGVTAALGDNFTAVLLERMQELGMYQITERDPDYFARRLRLGRMDDDSGLIGSGLLGHGAVAEEVVRT